MNRCKPNVAAIVIVSVACSIAIVLLNARGGRVNAFLHDLAVAAAVVAGFFAGAVLAILADGNARNPFRKDRR